MVSDVPGVLRKLGDPGSRIGRLTVAEGKRAIADVDRSLPAGYRLAWGGEYSEFLSAMSQVSVVGPLTVVLIFMILFALYGNLKFPVAVVLSVILTEPVGALLALKLTNTPFSVSSLLGLLVLMGVSVETAVIDVSYINKLRLEGHGIEHSTYQASLVRFRPTSAEDTFYRNLVVYGAGGLIAPFIGIKVIDLLVSALV